MKPITERSDRELQETITRVTIENHKALSTIKNILYFFLAITIISLLVSGYLIFESAN